MNVKIHKNTLSSDLDLSRKSDFLVARPRIARRLEASLSEMLEANFGGINKFVDFHCEGVTTALRFIRKNEFGVFQEFTADGELLGLVRELREARLVRERLPWYAIHFWRNGINSVWAMEYSYEDSTSGGDFSWVEEEDCMVDYATFPRSLDETPDWFRLKMGIPAPHQQPRAIGEWLRV